MSESLNEILGKIEEDLKKLQSAREKVLSVVESNQNFTAAANDLVKTTQSLIVEVTSSTENAMEQFSKSLIESKASVETIVKDGLSQIENSARIIKEGNLKIAETGKAELNNISTLSKESVGHVTSLSVKTIKDISAQVKTSMDEQKKNNIQVLEDTANQSVKIFKSSSELAEKTLNGLKNENLKTINHILETHNQIKLLIAQILDYDLPNNLKLLKSKVEFIEMEQKKQFDVAKKNQLMMFVGLAVIFATIIILHFVKN